MKNTRMAKIGLILGIGITVTLGYLAVTVMAAEKDMMKSGGMMESGGMMKEGGMMNPGKECTMKDMQQCTMTCTAYCQENMKQASEAMMLLDEAIKAIDMGNTADAKKDIEKAKMMLNEMSVSQKKCVANMPTVNDHCPISGKKIDMMNTPENLTTIYKGQKVGFCCPACPPAWDKLSDKEKTEKLDKVRYKAPEKEKMMMKNMPGEKKM